MAEAARRQPADNPPALIGVMGVVLEGQPEGVLWWQDERLLIVADLHLEKGSSFARRGQFLPPYDTGDTLARLARAVTRLDPATVLALGDSFHDDDGAARMTAPDRQALAALQRGRNWLWVAGNHDPGAPAGLAGEHCAEVSIGRLTFRHEPAPGPSAGEIAGHLHPAARVAGRGRTVRRRCFVGDGERLVMPAFGAYAGGLNVLDRAFHGLFARPLRAFILGQDRVYAVAHSGLCRD